MFLEKVCTHLLCNFISPSLILASTISLQNFFLFQRKSDLQCTGCSESLFLSVTTRIQDLNCIACQDVQTLDARFRNPPIGGFKHVECLCGTPWIVSLLKTWFFQLCMIASTLFWSNSMDTFNGLIVLRIHF